MDFSGTFTNQNINYQKSLDKNWVEYHQPSDMFPASNDHLDLNLIFGSLLLEGVEIGWQRFFQAFKPESNLGEEKWAMVNKIRLKISTL